MVKLYNNETDTYSTCCCVDGESFSTSLSKHALSTYVCGINWSFAAEIVTILPNH